MGAEQQSGSRDLTGGALAGRADSIHRNLQRHVLSPGCAGWQCGQGQATPDREKPLRTHRDTLPTRRKISAALGYSWGFPSAASTRTMIRWRVAEGRDGHASTSRVSLSSVPIPTKFASDFAARDWVEFRKVLSPRELAEFPSNPVGSWWTS